MKPVRSVEVGMAGQRVGELVAAPRGGLYFAYDPQWLATGFALSPLNMRFDAEPQAAPNTALCRVAWPRYDRSAINCH